MNQGDEMIVRFPLCCGKNLHKESAKKAPLRRRRREFEKSLENKNGRVLRVVPIEVQRNRKARDRDRERKNQGKEVKRSQDGRLDRRSLW